MHRKLVKATTLFAADTPTHSEDPVFIDEDVDENCTLPRIPPPLLHFLPARYWISATNSDAETVLAGASDEAGKHSASHRVSRVTQTAGDCGSTFFLGGGDDTCKGGGLHRNTTLQLTTKQDPFCIHASTSLSSHHVGVLTGAPVIGLG